MLHRRTVKRLDYLTSTVTLMRAAYLAELQCEDPQESRLAYFLETLKRAQNELLVSWNITMK